MTTRLLPTLFVFGLAAGALSLVPTPAGAASGFAQDPPRPGDLASRVDQLEIELERMAGIVDVMANENNGLRDQVEALDAALAGQAKQAKQLLSTFDTAEQQGFTAGINFESRVTLLEGLRAFAKEVQAGAKLGAEPAEDERPGARKRPR